MSVHSRPDDRNEVMIIGVMGDLDLSSAPGFRSAAHRLIEDGWSQMVIDLDGVDFLDSAGLGVLIGIRRRCMGANGNCVLARPTDDVQRVLKSSDVDRLFVVHSTVDEALTAARNEAR